jgi:hypothetical protein
MSSITSYPVASYPTRKQIIFLKGETRRELFRKKAKRVGIYTSVGIGLFGAISGAAYYFCKKE